MIGNGHAIVMTGVAKTYNAGSAYPLEVLKGVDLTVDAGATVAITGPSGSGKTTLLNILGTLDRPDSGHVTLNGEDLLSLEGRRLARFRARRIGFVFQDHHLLPQLTVLENVLIPSMVERPPGAQKRARLLLERVGLTERLHHRPGQLSGGERQRTAVARALINSPVVLLADEPTGSLDRKNASKLGKLLVELNEEERTVLVVVTHSTRLAGEMETVLELRNGSLHQA